MSVHRLTKDQRATRDRLLTAAEKATETAQVAVEAYNHLLLDSLLPLFLRATDRLEEVNEAVEEFNAWREDLAEDLRANFDERSDAWRESERGAAVEDWIDILDETLEGIDTYVNEPEEIEEPYLDLPYLPDAPEST